VGSVDLRDFAEFGMWTEKDGKLTTQDIRNWKTSEGIGLGKPRGRHCEGVREAFRCSGFRAEDHNHQKGKKLLLYKGRSTEWSEQPDFASAMEQYLSSNWKTMPSLGRTA